MMKFDIIKEPDNIVKYKFAIPQSLCLFWRGFRS
jgi:hypothetical protein